MIAGFSNTHLAMIALIAGIDKQASAIALQTYISENGPLDDADGERMREVLARPIPDSQKMTDV